MIRQPFDSLVDSLAAKTPTPGGGAAAAMAACMGTALFLMVIRFARGKKVNADREQDLARAEERLQQLLDLLKPMAERDCAAFDRVAAAYKMPRGTESEQALREKAVQEAMVGAMVVPEETLCMVRDVCEAMAGVVPRIGKSTLSDLASGAALLRAGAESALLNVRINAGFLTNRTLADSTMKRARAVLDEIHAREKAIADAVDGALA
ncbi:MAG: cyclodeaminase/cyclohydrolase family protein [Planctomycetota bacterium]